jgi:hypothetical protein
MNLFVSGHGRRGGRVLGVGRAAFGTLCQCKDKNRAEVAGKEAQELASQRCLAGLPGMLAQQPPPVGLVASLRFRQGKKDVPLFALAGLGQIAVNGGLSPFVGEVLAPAPDVRRRGLGV